MNKLSQINTLSEGLEQGDLARLINTTVTIDEFVSKMGDDQDVAVLAFRVGGKEPATDLMNFLERGYEWILDSDVSPGELDNGEYITFVELERTPSLGQKIQKIMMDVSKLTDEDDDVWQFTFKDDSNEYPLTAKLINKVVPTTPEEYQARYSSDVEYADAEFDKQLKAMQEVARVPINKNKQFLDDDIKSLKARAGLL